MCSGTTSTTTGPRRASIRSRRSPATARASSRDRTPGWSGRVGAAHERDRNGWTGGAPPVPGRVTLRPPKPPDRLHIGRHRTAHLRLTAAPRASKGTRACRAKEIVMASSESRTPVSIVLVHGGFVDGSGWAAVYRILKSKVYEEGGGQNPTF